MKTVSTTTLWLSWLHIAMLKAHHPRYFFGASPAQQLSSILGMLLTLATSWLSRRSRQLGSAVIMLGVLACAVFAAPAANATTPVPDAYFKMPALPLTPDVPAEVLIGEDFTFKVRFKNTAAGSVGYAPFIDLKINTRGADGNTGTPPGPCDGLIVNSAALVNISGSPPPLTPQVIQPNLPTTCESWPPITHPYPAPANPVPAPVGWQLQVIDLPFGSFEATQPEVVVSVSAQVH